MPKRKKSKNHLFIELCRATGELDTLKRFKKREFSNSEKGAIIASMLKKLPEIKRLQVAERERIRQLEKEARELNE